MCSKGRGPSEEPAIDVNTCLEFAKVLGRSIRDQVSAACRERSPASLGAIVAYEGGDTIYAIDRIGEAELLRLVGRAARDLGGVVLIAEGLREGYAVLPEGSSKEQAAIRVIVDPIDGTRGLIYQKRPAWVAIGVAPNLGDTTTLGDIEVATQTEIPLNKQTVTDELWAVRGQGAWAEHVNLLDGSRQPFTLSPSQASSIEGGFATISRFIPGGRDVLAAIDDEVVLDVLGPQPPGRASCFEDQYISTAGQLYELAVGHDRFVADLRPLLRPVLESRGQPLGLTCHPYDLSAVLIAEEAGVILTDARGRALAIPLEVDAEVDWIGYANASLQAQVEPALRAALARRGLL